MGLDSADSLFHSKLLVPYGTHALTLMIHDVDPKFAILLLATDLDAQYARILQPQGDTTLLSLPDGTWKYTLELRRATPGSRPTSTTVTGCL